MRKIIVNFFKLLLFFIIIWLSWNYKLVIYGVSQLKGQLNIVFNAIPVSEALADSSLDSTARIKLVLVEDIRKFAFDSVGLDKSENYTTFYNQHHKPVMWVVTGCLPYSLQPKLWEFPFLGHVSYKGFFKESKALREAEMLRAERYETDIYSPSAWSTLGFFTDPILSGFLKRSDGAIAELIIHELTHETIYLKSSVDFNENFATFVGEKGAEKFLSGRFGPNSRELKNYLLQVADDDIYGEYMLRSSQRLDSLYKTFTPELSIREKALSKYRMIAQIMLGVNSLPLNFPKRYRHDFIKKPLPNNTEFMAFLRYRKKQEIFQKVFESDYNNDLKFFLADITRKAKNNETLPFDITEISK